MSENMGLFETAAELAGQGKTAEEIIDDLQAMEIGELQICGAMFNYLILLLQQKGCSDHQIAYGLRAGQSTLQTL